VGLKLFGVRRSKLFGEGNNATLSFKTSIAFFAKDAQQMSDFTTAKSHKMAI